LDWTGNSYDNTGELSATSWRHVKFIEQFPDGTPSRPGEPSRAGAARLAAPPGRVSLDVLPDGPGAGRWLMIVGRRVGPEVDGLAG
jgi:formate dehydrogenase iron-sulfur subunit